MDLLRRRNRLIGFLGPTTLAFALATPIGGCSKTVSYTYVDVHVSIDPNTINETRRYLVTSCELQVNGADMTEAVGLHCIENNVPYDVGTFQWTSQATTGTLEFRVRLFDGNHVVIGDATSEPVAVTPGKHLETSVLVLGVATAPGPDGGTDAQTPADGAVDAKSDTPAEVGSADRPAVDAAADGLDSAIDSASEAQTGDTVGDTASDGTEAGG